MGLAAAPFLVRLLLVAFPGAARAVPARPARDAGEETGESLGIE
jgi:hypothetical protein